MIKNINGYNGDYKISDNGFVFSMKTGELRKLKPTKLKNGYLSVKLSKKGKSKTHYVHRLVAEHFLFKNNDKLITNHKNGIKTDNRIENLEWCTYSENLIHAFNKGLNKNKGSSHANAKLTAEQVYEIKLRSKKERSCDLSREFNVSQQCICDIKKGRRWAHVQQ